MDAVAFEQTGKVELTGWPAAVAGLAAVDASLVVHGVRLLWPGTPLLGAPKAQIQLNASVDARGRILRRQDLPAPDAGHAVYDALADPLRVKVCMRACLAEHPLVLLEKM